MKIVKKGSSNFNQPVGNFQSFNQVANHFVIEAENANIQIIPYSDSIFRIRIALKGQSFTGFSYAIAEEPMQVEVSVTETTDSITFQTKGAQLLVSKNPFRISFFNAQGTLLSEDDQAFGTSWLGNEVTTYKKLQEGERFIGLGEKTGDLDRRGQSYVNWNTDYFAYPVDADPIYLSTPFYIGLHNETQYGVFFDNTHKTTFSFGCSNNRFSYFQAEDGEMNYYLFAGNNVKSIIESFTWLTGRMSMPPLWSLGFQQCRYSYYPTFEVINAAKMFRDKDIPCDVLYLDIHYMDAYKVFTWHPERFPDPKKMMADLKEDGFNMVVILDPGIKKEVGYHAYDDGKAKDLFVSYPDGEEYNGQVWPGWSAFPDFTHEEVRKWWGDHMKAVTDVGVEGFWIDMNEPAAWGQHLPDLIEFAYEGEGGTHKKSRNVYGYQMARSTFEGGKKLLKGKRPFVLTRAGYCGVQRYAAVWTGDNISADDHMLAGVRLVNSMGLTGISNAGYDVGGFAGEATPDLFARWISIGAFSPFFRSHSMVNSRDSEPWSFGEEVEDISRNYIKLRYRLMPYLYSAFYESAKNGMPVARSLAIDYTHDAKIYHGDYQNQYLFGPSILVCPVESYKPFAKVYFPKGKWFNFFTDQLNEGESEHIIEVNKEVLPLYVKAGSVLICQSAVNSLQKETPKPTLEVHYYAGGDFSFEYYEDDGQTYEYENQKFFKRIIASNQNNEIDFGKVSGDFTSKFNKIRFYLHTNEKISNVKLKQDEFSKDLTLNHENYRWINPVSDFDPYHKPPAKPIELNNLPYVEFDHSTFAFSVIVS